MIFRRNQKLLLKPSPWRTSRTKAGWFRVSTTIDRKKIFFETRDGTLNPCAEAMASICLLPSMQNGIQAQIPMHAQPSWVANARKLAAQFGDWWGWENTLPLRFDPQGETTTPTCVDPAASAAFYSGGVDSVYTLSYPSRPLKALICVAGFDTRLRDTQRLDWMEQALRKAAHSKDLEPVWIRTNLRRWKRFETCNWERTHGSAMAAIGHLLSHRFGSILIPSTAPNHRVQKHGSTSVTDPLWGHSKLEFIHDGGDCDRDQKIDKIADVVECKEQLRVCWKNEAKAINCGRCEKCLRTMLLFLANDQPLPLTFPEEGKLVEHVRTAEPIPPKCLPLYQNLPERLGKDSELARTVRRWVSTSS